MPASLRDFQAGFNRAKARRQELAGGVRQLISDLESINPLRNRAAEVDFEIEVLRGALAVLAQQPLGTPSEREADQELRSLEATLELVK